MVTQGNRSCVSSAEPLWGAPNVEDTLYQSRRRILGQWAAYHEGGARLRVEMWKTGRVRPYENNPRANDSAVEAVAKSIENYGFRQPIVVDKKGVIVVGHARWKAAKRLGLTTIPVHVARDLTPAQARAYRIADNKTAELADWDDRRLVAELEALRDASENLEALAFTPKELSTLLGTVGDNTSLQYTTKYEVIVECADEAQQRDVYEKMTKENCRCRVLTY